MPDPHIYADIAAALGPARTVINVGAGAGSYEPLDSVVTAVEPSASMRAQRPVHLTAAVDGVAEDLPFSDNSFDAALASFTVHQWRDLPRGLSEVRRVTTGPVVIVTCDPDAVGRFWLAEYAPEVLRVEARRYPPIREIARLLGGRVDFRSIAIPHDCTDGFGEAYYGRPEMFLDPDARRANSAWSFVDAAVVRRFEERLREDLESGAWDARHGSLRTQTAFDGSLRLVVGEAKVK